MDETRRKRRRAPGGGRKPIEGQEIRDSYRIPKEAADIWRMWVSTQGAVAAGEEDAAVKAHLRRVRDAEERRIRRELVDRGLLADEAIII